MKNIIPKDSRYVPFVQLKSCCVPACISMVMYKHNIPLLPQELLGYYLGLTVSQENKKLYWNPRTGKRPPSNYGTQIYLKKYHPNTVFPRLKIPLKMVFYPISSFTTEKNLIKFVTEAVQKDKDILACFDHGKLSGDNIQGGHVCVVDRIDTKKGLIRLIDPQQTQPKWRIVKIKALIKAMEFHGDDKSAGFWEFVKI
jgi:hypothetical protein